MPSTQIRELHNDITVMMDIGTDTACMSGHRIDARTLLIHDLGNTHKGSMAFDTPDSMYPVYRSLLNHKIDCLAIPEIGRASCRERV